MNFPTTKIKDFIHIERNAIGKQICENVISSTIDSNWEKHTWTIGGSNIQERFSNKEDPEVLHPNKEIQKKLKKFTDKSISQYKSKFFMHSDNIKNQRSEIRINKYFPGQKMEGHHDHIYSLFDGNRKGIPILSVILNFNDNYEGAELYFWKGFFKTKLGQGDIIIFPSNFMFPHGVTECREGCRYSGVIWYW